MQSAGYKCEAEGWSRSVELEVWHKRKGKWKQVRWEAGEWNKANKKACVKIPH